MTTQNFRTRGLRSAAAVGIGVAAGVLATLAARRHALESLRIRLDHLERSAHTQQDANLATQQRQHWELLSKAIDDPELAEVLDLYEASVSPKQRRQYLFANALYTNLLFYYRIGNLSKDEFFKHVRGMFQNPIVREYWYTTQQQRASLADTDEAELGLLVDALLQQLEEADTEEWWVVGESPGESPGEPGGP
ncbi:DUF6082 family protein [Streptomyces sp. NBC_00485]|uniref:DUF6082 family protein n=1 Tax=unclassified Streptomyces TaxID=2593676 RepID=UPI002E16C3BA|nr:MULTISPECIES: DUF6082 family protein [unclassified Streptomyces]